MEGRHWSEILSIHKRCLICETAAAFKEFSTRINLLIQLTIYLIKIYYDNMKIVMLCLSFFWSESHFYHILILKFNIGFKVNVFSAIIQNQSWHTQIWIIKFPRISPESFSSNFLCFLTSWKCKNEVSWHMNEYYIPLSFLPDMDWIFYVNYIKWSEYQISNSYKYISP